MYIQRLLHKFSISAFQKAGKFKFNIKRVTFILLICIVSLKALLMSYKAIENSQENTRLESIQQQQTVTSYEYDLKPIQLQSFSIEEPVTIIIETETVVEDTIEPVEEVIIEYDPPETIYDYFTDKEINMIERLVEAEATGGNLYDKMNVANVIYNRYFSDDFPDTIEGVVFQKTGKYYQFSPIGDKRYYKVEVTQETKEAVYKAFMEPDTTDGALFFCNERDVKNNSFKKWFKSLELIMKDDIGHSFYK